MVAVFCLLIMGVTSFFRLSRDARCLRTSLTSAADAQAVGCSSGLELSVGPITCCLARAGLSLAPLNAEARTALRAVRGAEVGVYQLARGSSELDRSSMVGAADKAMAGRGWDRLAGVVHEDDLVLVYVPRKSATGAKLDACVAVITGRQLIVVEGRTNLEPLLELASHRPEWKHKSWTSARL
jgi:hypothetical protein